MQRSPLHRRRRQMSDAQIASGIRQTAFAKIEFLRSGAQSIEAEADWCETHRRFMVDSKNHPNELLSDDENIEVP